MKISYLKFRNSLRSDGFPLKFTKEQVDSDKGIIRNVVMCEAGEAKGHNVHLENEFIENLVAYDQKHFSKSGIKARFGHPALSSTTMGSQLGHFHNIRYREVEGKGQAIGDLHLLESANKSPNAPKSRDWLLSMADEAPDFVMSSIVFIQSALYQYDEDGEKDYDIFFINERGFDELKDKSKKVYVEFNEEQGAKHYYTDLVEQGAATDNLFSQQFNKDKFAIQVIGFIQDHPALYEFLQENPSKIISFCEKLNITLPKPSYSFGEKLKALTTLFGAKDGDEALSKLQTEFDTEKAEFQKQLQQLKEEKAELQKQLQKKEEELSTKEARIQELSERVPDDHSDVEPSEDKQRKKFDPVTEKAMKWYKRRHQNNN